MSPPDSQIIRMMKPEPKDLSHHLSSTTKNRSASSVKKFYKYFAIPGIGQLAGGEATYYCLLLSLYSPVPPGLPNGRHFPYDTLEAKAALPERWTPTPNEPVEPPTSKLAKTTLKEKPTDPPESQVVVPHTSTGTNPVLKIDLDTALQYGQAQGYPPLYSFLYQFAREHLHPNVPYKGGPDIILTCGSTDGFSKALQAFNNEWREGQDAVEDREGILCEEYAYMNAIQACVPRGLNIAPVGIDDEGMRADGPGGLKEVLENWDFSKGKRPHLMYTVT
jgi:DNA-binding transcriptional MocR family regulator